MKSTLQKEWKWILDRIGHLDSLMATYLRKGKPVTFRPFFAELNFQKEKDSKMINRDRLEALSKSCLGQSFTWKFNILKE